MKIMDMTYKNDIKANFDLLYAGLSTVESQIWKAIIAQKIASLEKFIPTGIFSSEIIGS